MVVLVVGLLALSHAVGQHAVSDVLQNIFLDIEVLLVLVELVMLLGVDVINIVAIGLLPLLDRLDLLLFLVDGLLFLRIAVDETLRVPLVADWRLGVNPWPIFIYTVLHFDSGVHNASHVLVVPLLV